MTGKNQFKLATQYIFKLYFVSVFEVNCLIGFVAQVFKLRFHLSCQCRNIYACAVIFFVQMLEKMVSFQILLSLLVGEQNSISCPFRHNSMTLLCFASVGCNAY